MAYIKGSTDVQNLTSDLYNLITGAASGGQRGSGQAGNGVIATGDDAWTALDPAYGIVRGKDTTKFPALPYRMWNGIPRFGIQSGCPYGYNELMGKPTFSGSYNHTVSNVYFLCYVSTANTTPGDLTGTVVTYTVVNSDTGSTVKSSTTVSGWSGSTDTKELYYGIYLTLTLEAGESFTANAIYWGRAYSQSLPNGIDYHPDVSTIDTSKSIVISTSPSGSNEYTLNTDYVIVGTPTAYPAYNTMSYRYKTECLGLGLHYGISWMTSGSTPASGQNYYIVDADVFPLYFQIIGRSGNKLYVTMWDYWDPVSHTGRGSNTISTDNTTPAMTTSSPYPSYITFFSSSTPSTSWYINYYLSIKKNKINLILYGDPGNGGYTVPLIVQLLQPGPSNIRVPMIIAQGGMDKTAIRSAMSYEVPYYIGSTLSTESTNFGMRWYRSATIAATKVALIADGLSLSVSTYVSLGSPILGKTNIWELSRLTIKEVQMGYTNGVPINMNDDYGTVGYLDGIGMLPGGGWSNLDELVTESSRYLLIKTTDTISMNNDMKNLWMLEE